VGGNDLNGGGVLGDQGGDDHFLQRFALRSHNGYDPVLAMKFALEHQNPLSAGRVDGGDAYPEWAYSLLSVDDPNVLLWVLKPADDGIESGLVVRLWNLSNEKNEFSLSVDGGINGALALTHIETPIGIASVRDGSLMDVVNQQQLKTYAIFPAQLPYAPDTTGLDTATATPPAGQPTPTSTADVGNDTPVPVTNTPLPPSFTHTAEPAEQNGKGCLFGLLYVLGLLKK
jgi:hypothetical protein